MCQTVATPHGTAIVCGVRMSRRRCACGRDAQRLCDWKVTAKASGTCDAAVCNACTTSPAPDKDLCRKHAAAYADWQRQRRLPLTDEARA